MVRHLVLGTAGHIDHGKTSLVKALTDVDTDRLPEEKRRGITIELGFAPWRLADDFEASIVDVPGHERLVRTMVAGAGGIDIAMLVIAADDGVMPQTREHLDILKLLGVPAGIVVLSKCDLVGADLIELVTEDIKNQVRDTVFEGAPLVPTSSRTGAGLDVLKSTVLELAERVERRHTSGPAFLPLDRSFVRAGYGVIGTGTMLRGTLTVGQSVEVLGERREPLADLKIRGLQALGADRNEASAGMRTAVNLHGRSAEHVGRGMVVASAGSFALADACVAQVEVLPHARALGEEVLEAHLGTTERAARVIPLGAKELPAGSAGGVLLRFDRPVPCFAGQRLVLRRPGVHGQATVAGGEILDPEPPRGKGAVSLAASQLEALRGNPRDRLLAIATESRAAGITQAAIVRRLPAGAGDEAVRQLEKRGELVRVGDRWVVAPVIEAAARRVVALVHEHHEANPMSPGLAEPEVASQLPPPERHLAGIAVERALAKKAIVRDGTVLALPGRGATVDARAKEELDKLRAAVASGGLTPPSDVELAGLVGIDKQRVGELLGLLRRSKALIKIADGQHYAPEVLADLEARVILALRDGRELTASELKEVAGPGVTRKWAIPLCEYLDKARVTLRVGDIRRLHPSRK